MLTLPDFMEKQILIIFAEDIKANSLSFSNDNVVYKKDDEIVNKLSCFKVFAMFVVGDCTISTPLIKNCKKYGISLFLLNGSFEPYAEVLSSASANYLLREKQYSATDDFAHAKILIENKIYNQLSLLKEKGMLNDFNGRYGELKEKIQACSSEKELLGFEGNVSKEYFGLLFNEFGWYRRMPQSKVDELNVLMDIGYTFLFNFMSAMLALYGFDLYRGFYHKLYFQRKSLACDLMEPFRFLIDKQIVKGFNLKQIQKKDFSMKAGRYYLPFAVQKKYCLMFLNCLLENKEDIFKYVKEYYRMTMAKGDFPIYQCK